MRQIFPHLSSHKHLASNWAGPKNSASFQAFLISKGADFSGRIKGLVFSYVDGLGDRIFDVTLHFRLDL